MSTEIAHASVSDCKIKWDKACVEEKTKAGLSQLQCFCEDTNFSVTLETDKSDKVHSLGFAFAD